MKLLLDENLSHRIITDLEQIYPGSSQVSLLNLSEATDAQIWNYAREHDYAIVTLDADFYDYSLLQGGPPLVIWLRCGNQRKVVIKEKLLIHQRVIETATADDTVWCVEIY